MTRRRIVTTLFSTGLCVSIAGFACAQEAKKAPGKETKEQVNARYAMLRMELERRHLNDLAAVAARQIGKEADDTYREIFSLAITHDLYRETEPIAEAAIKTGKLSPEVEALAHLINVTAEADQEHFDESLAHLREFMEARDKAADDGKTLDTATVLAISEAYFQRLTHAGRYDIARKVAKLGAEGAKNPDVKAHFAARLERLDRVGKPAPPISGSDVDGKPVKLSDYKGKVVLVDFWATWCPPCSAEMYRFNRLADKFGASGLVVLGVNEDAYGDAAAAKADAIRSTARRFLIDHRVSWPNLIDLSGNKGIAAAYGVSEIPANFLIGRDGTIVAFELSGADLDRAVNQALAKK